MKIGWKTTAAALTIAAGMLAGQQAQAAPLAGANLGPIMDYSLVQKAQYYYEGHRYCWYFEGWRGPGWYWCGYPWRRGYGWGGGDGWRGWGRDRDRDRGRERDHDRDRDRDHDRGRRH